MTRKSFLASALSILTFGLVRKNTDHPKCSSVCGINPAFGKDSARMAMLTYERIIQPSPWIAFSKGWPPKP